MKYNITQFKSLAIALKELQPFILNGSHLESGKPFKRFGGLRSRELLANWLVCVVANFAHCGDFFMFSSDPSGADGLIRDSRSNVGWHMEHTLVPSRRRKNETVETSVLSAIQSKQLKGGAAYAAGKTLIVMVNAGGTAWYPNKVAKALPSPLDFDDVWIVGLHCVKEGEYAYNVSLLELTDGNVPIWRVTISKEFDSWTVERVQ